MGGWTAPGDTQPSDASGILGLVYTLTTIPFIVPPLFTPTNSNMTVLMHRHVTVVTEVG